MIGQKECMNHLNGLTVGRAFQPGLHPSRVCWRLTFCLDTIHDLIVGTSTLPRRIWAGWYMSKGTDISDRCS